MTDPRRVLILGADGFIGRHLAFALRAGGWQVLAQARHPGRLAAMGFATLAADLTHPATHDPAFWGPHLPPGTALVNAAGLLTGPKWWRRSARPWCWRIGCSPCRRGSRSPPPACGWRI
jgi:nucleoside-diphosphate-sugar epimerase